MEKLTEIKKEAKHPFKDAYIYKVHVYWQGFEDGDKTWEPLENLIADVPEMVKEFLRD